MSTAQILDLGRDFLLTTMLLALPTLAVSMIVGLIISVLQTVTNIQEQTMSFVPRLLAVGLLLGLTMAWMLQVAQHFTLRMIWQATEAVR